MAVKTVLAALVVGSILAGCARTAPGYESSAQPAGQAITVDVQNDYMLAMDIYAVASGVSRRLGSVGPGMKDSLLLDPSFMLNGLVEIVARPAGGGPTVSSGQLNPLAGQTVNFYIGMNLIHSFASIS